MKVIPALDHATPLRQVALFADLDPAALAAVAQRAHASRFAPGELLFQEGEACAGIFVLTQGTVRIFKLSASGRELTLHREEAPATVAEVPLVDGGAYPASVQALTEVTALFIRRQDFLAACRQHPEVALAALAVLGRRLRTLVALLEAVTFGGVRQRLARLLLDQAAAPESVRSPRALAGTHQDLALGLGTVREVVSRNLSRFQAEGLIRVKHREIELLDEPGLAREAELDLEAR